VWVIDRVHGRTANVRSATEPTSTTCFAEANIHVITVADLTDRRSTSTWHAANFAGRQQQLCPISFASLKSRLRSCTTAHDSTATRSHLNATNRSAKWDILQW
jgi:hypothetical protein